MEAEPIRQESDKSNLNRDQKLFSADLAPSTRFDHLLRIKETILGVQKD